VTFAQNQVDGGGGCGGGGGGGGDCGDCGDCGGLVFIVVVAAEICDVELVIGMIVIGGSDGRGAHPNLSSFIILPSFLVSFPSQILKTTFLPSFISHLLSFLPSSLPFILLYFLNCTPLFLPPVLLSFLNFLSSFLNSFLSLSKTTHNLSWWNFKPPTKTCWTPRRYINGI
jgi:hypothetical protein